MNEGALFLIAVGPLAIGSIVGLVIRAQHAAAMATKASEEAGGAYFGTEDEAKAFIRKQVFKYGILQRYSIERLQDGRFEVVPETGRARVTAPPAPPDAGGLRFRVHGAEQETGEESVFEIRASTGTGSKGQGKGGRLSRPSPRTHRLAAEMYLTAVLEMRRTGQDGVPFGSEAYVFGNAVGEKD